MLLSAFKNLRTVEHMVAYFAPQNNVNLFVIKLNNNKGKYIMFYIMFIMLAKWDSDDIHVYI